MVKFFKGTAAQRASSTKTGTAGDLVIESDTGNIAVANGSTLFSALKRLARTDEVAAARAGALTDVHDDIAGGTGPVATVLSASYVGRWKALTAYLATDLRMAPDGKIIQRNADGTSRATYDATEQAAWTVVAGSSSGFDITDNGDGTATLTATGSSSITDNGDGTATLAA